MEAKGVVLSFVDGRSGVRPREKAKPVSRRILNAALVLFFYAVLIYDFLVVFVITPSGIVWVLFLIGGNLALIVLASHFLWSGTTRA